MSTCELSAVLHAAILEVPRARRVEHLEHPAVLIVR